MSKVGCRYCDYFSTLKTRKKRRDKPDIKRCHVAKRLVSSERVRECAYFLPTTKPFYCDNNGCQLDLMQCIARRRNRMNLQGWDNCRKCRQWDQELREVVEKYILDMARAKKPEPEKKKRKIKRREARIIIRRAKGKSRKLKRREVKPKKRKLKRRG